MEVNPGLGIPYTLRPLRCREENRLFSPSRLRIAHKSILNRAALPHGFWTGLSYAFALETFRRKK
jgi:hypothetical protein